MHSFLIPVFAVLLALGQPSRLAGSSPKELEQKYNKIFSGSLFAQDPATTKQWLKELYQQLDENDAGQREKCDKVRKLLVFDKIDPDCDLTKGSGNELVDYHSLFAAPNSTTSTIRTYIASCLERIYDECKESFVAQTEGAVRRLSDSPDYWRMVRLKELVADNKSDLIALVARFLLEQVNVRPRDEYEFANEFDRLVGGPCETVRGELHFMFYFDALLSTKQIKSMGEIARQWHKVHSVCRWLTLGEQSVKADVFERMSILIKREDMMIHRKYRQVFGEATLAWPLKPEKTYSLLLWLQAKLKKLEKNRRNDLHLIFKRQTEVEKMVKVGEFWHFKQCEMADAEEVNVYLTLYAAEHKLNMMRYLMYLRDQAFELCRFRMAQMVAGSVRRLEQDPLWSTILRLKESIAKKFDPVAWGRGGQQQQQQQRVNELLFSLAGGQAGGMLNTVDVHRRCQRICQEFHYLEDVRTIWRVEVANQMEPTVRDWFLSFQACCT